MPTTHDPVTPRLPVAVYGTLRPGCGNDSLWHRYAEARHDGTAYVIGWKLVTLGRAFPYMVPAAGAQTVVALIVPDDEHYDLVLSRMDTLEGYPVHYDRVQVPVMVPADGEVSIVRAWTYTPVHWRDRLLPDCTTNADGFYDWCAHRMHEAWTPPRGTPGVPATY